MATSWQLPPGGTVRDVTVVLLPQGMLNLARA